MSNQDPRWVITFRRAGAAETETVTVQAQSMVTAIKQVQQELREAHDGLPSRILLCEPVDESAAETIEADMLKVLTIEEGAA